jgi:16S rRNA (cytosine967-C5)-methyltransferase
MTEPRRGEAAGPAEPPAPARDRVVRRLAAQARRFPQLELDPLDTTGLDDRDAALAVAIDQAVARRWLTLACVLGSCLDRRGWAELQPRVQAPLLAGAAQLLLFERLPEHAVVDHAVGWIAAAGNRRAAGLVNAVLHRVVDLRLGIEAGHDPQRRDEVPLPDGRAWRLRRAVFAEDPLERLAQVTSHPEVLLRGWIAAFGHQAAARVAMHSIVHPPVILSGITGADARVKPHARPGHSIYAGPRGGLTALLADHPAARVQDPATALPVASTAGLAVRVAADVCAGRGTKTRQVAQLHPTAEILASDADAGRLAELRLTCADLPRARAVPPAALLEHAGRADLVVVDVPCSNTGVLARRPEAKYRFGPESLRSLVDRQRQILADSLRLLRPGGALLYATCSLEAAENQEQVAWLERWHPLRGSAAAVCMPAGVPGDGPEAYGDGGFHALLRGW